MRLSGSSAAIYPDRDQGIRRDMRGMQQVPHLDLGQSVRDWKMRGQNAHERAAAREHGRGLYCPNPGSTKDFTARGKLLIRGYVLNDNRITSSECSCARTDVCNINSLEEIQELVAKTRLRFDLKITVLPVHQLNVAQTSTT
jgi:hypothetical protein